MHDTDSDTDTRMSYLVCIGAKEEEGRGKKEEGRRKSNNCQLSGFNSLLV
ncbi:MAG: hypothetical protein ACRC62_00945 [Microcoleus sp.]